MTVYRRLQVFPMPGITANDPDDPGNPDDPDDPHDADGPKNTDDPDSPDNPDNPDGSDAQTTKTTQTTETSQTTQTTQDDPRRLQTTPDDPNTQAWTFPPVKVVFFTEPYRSRHKNYRSGPPVGVWLKNVIRRAQRSENQVLRVTRI